MHPEILWELNAQRGREMRARARQAGLARMAIRSRRHRRSRPDQADEFVVPAIPDYVDGSFHTEPVHTEPVNTGPVHTGGCHEADHAPAARHAA